MKPRQPARDLACGGANFWGWRKPILEMSGDQRDVVRLHAWGRFSVAFFQRGTLGVKLRNLTKVYSQHSREVAALNNVSLGAAGKSTLIRCV